MADSAETGRPRINVSRGFMPWLAASGGSIALTTYQSGRFLLLGADADGSLSWFEREFVRPMGIAVTEDARSIVLVTQFQIHRFNDVVAGEAGTPFDAAFVPHVSWTTGSVDAHDVGFASDGRPIFVNTLYSCVARVSGERNFDVLWTPPFVSDLAAEDRCHLNGMAMVDGAPRFVTAVSRADVKDGWRDRRGDGGIVMDLEGDRIVAESLSMPHSPRYHRDRLWLLNSGAGAFGFVDLARGTFEPIAFCPGYARGLRFAGRFAIIGLSAPRADGAFEGLRLQSELEARKQEPFCGLLVVDLTTARSEWLKFEGAINELYDVAFLPGVRKPSLVGFKTDEIKLRVSFARA